MKRIFMLFILLVMLLSGCFQGDTDKKLTSNDLIEKKTNKDEVTIAIWEDNYHYYQVNLEMLVYSLDEIEKETGLKIKYDIIKGETQEEFFKKLNTKLYLDKGPTLIYLCETPIKIYTDSGVALNLDGKLKNLNKIYDSIKDKNNYFVPIGMKTGIFLIDRDELNYLGIKEPEYDWSWDDYISIKNKWLGKNKVKLRRYIIRDLYDYNINQLDIIDTKNKEANINTEEMKKCIKGLREEFFGGKYILPKDFKEGDYYNAYFTTKNISEQGKEEYKRFIRYYNQDYILIYTGEHALYPYVTNKRNKENKIIVSNIINGDRNLSLGGFLVNKNGENIEEGIKFINYLLSDEVQKKLYNSEREPYVLSFYPVNKDIEDEIKKLEKNRDLSDKALKIKAEELEKIKSGENKPKLTYEDQNMSIYILKDKLYKDIFKLVFADEEYSDSKLERKLQELENQYNIYLNE
ncbi:extracellular solute-binding protein [Dethiothermospora halolimnae]|uniref:extracellular solute-binding protein n=1 Tax=Dethiothermospora halolimnae TaxID=3114390 RepID=UPI003CCB9AE9